MSGKTTRTRQIKLQLQLSKTLIEHGKTLKNFFQYEEKHPTYTATFNTRQSCAKKNRFKTTGV